jgi:ribosome recycling factor
MLVKATIKSSIKKAFKDQAIKKDNPESALDDLAGKIADAVIDAIKSAQITYTAGLTTAPGGGPVTGMFNYTIS